MKPLVYVTTWRIKEGRLEDYTEFSKKLLAIFEAREPQLIGIHLFINEDGSELTSIQIHPDAASMDLHMQVVNSALAEDMAEWVERADFLEPMHIEIYGEPSQALLDADEPFVKAGIARSIKPRHLIGFTHV